MSLDLGGFFGAVIVVLCLLGTIFLGLKQRKALPPAEHDGKYANTDPEEEAKKADEQIQQTRDDLTKLSDEALAELFNKNAAERKAKTGGET